MSPPGMPRAVSIDTLAAAAEALADRTFKYIGVEEGLFDPVMECDAEMKDLAERVYRFLGKKPPASPSRAHKRTKQ